jgi:hypothetical protein
MTQDEIEQKAKEYSDFEWEDESGDCNFETEKEICYDGFKAGVEFAQSKLYSEEEITFIKKVFLSYWLENNSSHEDNLEEKIFSDKILEKLINK